VPARVCRLALVVAFTAIALVRPERLAAHGDIPEQIAGLTARIRRDRRNATLYLKRGELYRVHRKWDAAGADYDRAARLDPTMASVDLCRGLALSQSGRNDAARAALERFVARKPENAEGHAALARVLARLGQSKPAADHFTRAIERSVPPRPEYFLERARALASGTVSDLDAALRGLDRGIEILGPLVSLQIPAIEMELARNNADGALARLQTILTQAEQKEAWLVRRGEILDAAGRCEEAREAFAAALEALERTPAPARGSASAGIHEARLRAAIESYGP
jgi:tetratricopeptide (TPR) repeat protein